MAGIKRTPTQVIREIRGICGFYQRGHFTGKLIPDLIVDGKVIVDAKLVTAFNDSQIFKCSVTSTLQALKSDERSH